MDKSEELELVRQNIKYLADLRQSYIRKVSFTHAVLWPYLAIGIYLTWGNGLVSFIFVLMFFMAGYSANSAFTFLRYLKGERQKLLEVERLINASREN